MQFEAARGVPADRDRVGDLADEGAARADVVEGEHHPTAGAVLDQAADVEGLAVQAVRRGDVVRPCWFVEVDRPDAAGLAAGSALVGKLRGLAREHQDPAAVDRCHLQDLELAESGTPEAEWWLHGPLVEVRGSGMTDDTALVRQTLVGSSGHQHMPARAFAAAFEREYGVAPGRYRRHLAS